MKNFFTSRFRSFSHPPKPKEGDLDPIPLSPRSPRDLPPNSPRPPPLPPPSKLEINKHVSNVFSEIERSLSSSGSLSSSIDSIGFTFSSGPSLSSSMDLGDEDYEDEGMVQTKTGAHARRYKILVELVATEASYTSSLWKMLTYYKEPLQGILSDAEISSIFSISDVLYDFHNSLLAGLTERMEQWESEILIGGFLLQMISFLRCYSTYVNNYGLAIETLTRCEEQSHFHALMDSLKNTVAEDGTKLQSLYSYLIMPIQRIPRYLLLLQDLQAHTPTDHPDSKNLKNAINIISEIASYIDSKRMTYQRSQRMAELSLAISHLPSDISVLKPHRLLVWEGSLFSKDEGKDFYCFIFNDACFITKTNSSRPRSDSAPHGGDINASTRSGSWRSASPQRGNSYRFVDVIWLNDPATVVISNYGEGLIGLTVLNEVPTASKTLLFQVSSASWQHTQPCATTDCLTALCQVLQIDIPPVINRDFLPPTLPMGNSASDSKVARSRSFLKSLTPISPRSRVSSIISATKTSTNNRASTRARSGSLTSGFSQPRLNGSTDSLPRSCSSFQSAQISHSTKILAGFVAPMTPKIPTSLPKWEDIEGAPDMTQAGVSSCQKDLMVHPCPGYHFEIGRNGRISSAEPSMLAQDFMYPESEIPFYETAFAHREHINLFALSEDGSNPVVVSIEAVEALPFRRAIIRSVHGEIRTVIPLTVGPFGFEYESFRAHLEQAFPSVLPLGMRWSKHFPDELPEKPLSPRGCLKVPTLRQQLCQYERTQKEQFDAFKVGVIFTKPGDVASGSDRTIFQTQQPSPEFSEFLQFLGDLFPLCGYQGFSGGLDTVNNRTGTHALRADFRSNEHHHEVLFHVCTLLPHSQSDEQQLAKKRHIGNDVVVIVFHQDEIPFDPRIFISKVTQVFIVISKVGTSPNGLPLYQLATICKDATPPWLPLLPETPIFEANSEFHRFLLAKIANAEAATQNHSPVFVSRVQRSRNDLLKEIITSYAKTE